MKRRERLLLRRVRLWLRLPASNHRDGGIVYPPVAKVGKRRRHIHSIGGMVLISELSTTDNISSCKENIGTDDLKH